MIGSWFGKRETPPWAKCKESLFEQVVLKNCTPSILATPDSMVSYNSSSVDIDEHEHELIYVSSKPIKNLKILLIKKVFYVI